MKADAVPAVTAAQMREIDRIMVDELHIELVRLDEPDRGTSFRPRRSTPAPAGVH